MYDWTNGAYKYLLEDETSDFETQNHYDWNHYKHKYFSKVQSTSTAAPRKTMRDYINENNTHIEAQRKIMGEYWKEMNNVPPVRTMYDHLYGYTYQQPSKSPTYDMHNPNWWEHQNFNSEDEPTMDVNNYLQEFLSHEPQPT